MLQEDVLYEPGLSKKLLSVRQWNITGGDVHFDINHCTLSVLDSNTNQSFDMAVRSPYASAYDDLHSPNANATAGFAHQLNVSEAFHQVPTDQSQLIERFASPAQQTKIKEESSNKLQVPEEDQKVKMTKVPSTLLHHRMGHRSIPVLLNASKHQACLDTKIGFKHDSFCEGCKISTSRKSNKGRTPLQKHSRSLVQDKQ